MKAATKAAAAKALPTPETPSVGEQLRLRFDEPAPTRESETRAAVVPMASPASAQTQAPARPAAPLPHDPWPRQFVKRSRTIAHQYAEEWGPSRTAIYDAFHDLIHGYNAKYPSGQVPLDAVARRAGVCLRTVKTYTAELVREGFIAVLRRGGFRRGPSTYRLRFVAESPKTVEGGRIRGFPCPGQSASLAPSSSDQSAKSAPCDHHQSAGFSPDQGAKFAPLGESQSVRKKDGLTDSIQPPKGLETQRRECSISAQPTAWKPTLDDAQSFARFVFGQVGVSDEAFALKVLKTARRAQSIEEVIEYCQWKACRHAPKGTGWFGTVVKERFGLLDKDGGVVDRRSIERAAAERFGGKRNIPYEFEQLLWESVELAAERLATWPK